VGPSFADRANILVQVLTRGLRLVAIDLQAQENSEEIFETLNARGSPLTAADLVKNFVFQRLEAEGVDTRRAYAEDWPSRTSAGRPRSGPGPPKEQPARNLTLTKWTPALPSVGHPRATPTPPEESDWRL
jgi:hypothetical protein